MSRTKIGDVQETFRTEAEVGFEWRIRNSIILRFLTEKHTCYISPNISFMGVEWCLGICPFYPISVYRVLYENQEWMMSLEAEGVKSVSVQYTIGIKTSDGNEREIVRDKTLTECQKSANLTTFPSFSRVLARMSELDPSDVLTVSCRIRSYKPSRVREETTVSCGPQTETVSDTGLRAEEGPRAEGGSRAEELNDLDIKGVFILRKHLKDLLLNNDYHDVTFKVQDQEFKAHRSMLTARSPVFAAMFKHEMKESTDDPIDVVDSSPEAFAEFLQYVYTGKVENLSPNVALGLYYAGDKYDVSGLKEICVEFLKTSLSTTAICDVITLAAKYGEEELHERAMAFFAEYLEEIMDTKEWQSFLAENLVHANKMCLNVLKERKTAK